MKRFSEKAQAGTLARWLSTAAGEAVFWIMPLARILMCGLLFLLLAGTAPSLGYHALLQAYFYIWLLWAVATGVAAIAGQRMNANQDPGISWIAPFGIGHAMQASRAGTLDAALSIFHMLPPRGSM